jgi:hypothetical protein
MLEFYSLSFKQLQKGEYFIVCVKRTVSEIVGKAGMCDFFDKDFIDACQVLYSQPKDALLEGAEE